MPFSAAAEVLWNASSAMNYVRLWRQHDVLNSFLARKRSRGFELEATRD
jgi:hypothetical protein